MTVANTLIALALRTSGVGAADQTPSATDVSDAFTILNDMIRQWIVQRTVLAIPIGTLAVFPDGTTDQPNWTPNENVLLTTLAVRLRSAFAMPPDETLNGLATNALQLFQAYNRQQVVSLHPGVPATCIQLITLALRMAGRITDQQGVSDTSADVTDALAMMAMLVGQWQRKRWLVPDLTETLFTSTGAASYTIGPLGAVVMARPDRIESAFARLTQPTPASAIMLILGSYFNNGGVVTSPGNPLPASPAGLVADNLWSNGGVVMAVPGGFIPTSPVGLLPGSFWSNGGVLMVAAGVVPSTGVDYPLAIMESREDYNRIYLKTFNTLPGAIFYDSAWPTGTLYLWPIPQAGAYEIHIFTKAMLPVYVTVNDALNLPPEYSEAMLYSLAVRIEMGAGGDPKPSHVQAMRAALNTIRMANTQVPSLQMPAGLPGMRRRGNGTNQAAMISGMW